MKKLALLLALAMMTPLTLSAQNPQMNARRQMLQGEIVQRFMERATIELGLDQPTRARLAQQLRRSGEQRRALAQSTTQLRLRMLAASRDSSTSDGQFRQLLSDMTSLRQKEEDLWKSDQDELARILTPRQHARFVFMWLRFNEQIREMALQGRRGPPLNR